MFEITKISKKSIYIFSFILSSIILNPQIILSQSNQFYLKEHLVVDLFTSTEWMRCSVGQRWNGETCIGKIISLNQAYRIPNLIFISIHYDKIIKIENFKTKNLYNFHFSLLPKYKGMHTGAHPIINGENYSGVTLHKIDNGIDTGDVIDQIKFK